MDNNTTTNEIMEFLQENMVTKEDAKAFATKEDLKSFATKEDLNTALAKQKSDIIDSVDKKLGELGGNLISLTRKEDKKVVSLIGVLKSKNNLSKKEAQKLLEMKPFPQIFN